MNKFYKINLIIDGFLLIVLFSAICFIPYAFKYYSKDNCFVDYSFIGIIITSIIQILLNILFLFYSMFIKQYRNILLSFIYILILMCFIAINYFFSMIMLVRGL